MQAEEFSSAQPFMAFPPYVSRPKDAALKELLRPCGKFCSPFTTEERVRLFITTNLQGADMLSSVTEVVAPGTPLNWQALLRYLHQKGLITEAQFRFSAISNDLPKSYHIGLRGLWDEGESDGIRVSKSGFSHSRSVEVAFSKTVGETLERSFLSLYKQADLLSCSYSDLVRAKRATLDIFALNSFLPWQEKRNSRLVRSDESLIHWVQGETVSGTPILLPAQLVFWNYSFNNDLKEQVLAHPTTSGAGGHFTKAGAMLSGLLENIERDAFIIYWLNRISPPVIDTSTIHDGEVRSLLASFDRYGLDVYFLNTTTDIGIPCVTCAIVDRRAENPILAIGSAAGFTIPETILHAGYEALAVLDSTIRLETFPLPENYEPFTDPNVGRMQRLTVWRGEKMLTQFSFFIQGKKQTAKEFIGSISVGESPQERLDYILERLAKLGTGYEVYVHEVKNEILKALGYHVVQTIVPQLIPIYLNEHLPTLNSKRLREVPEKLGYTAATELNPWPHPFP